MVASINQHYLQTELNQLLKNDDTIFNFLQEDALDGIWYWDLKQPDHEWMSPEFWQVFGYDPIDKHHLASEWKAIIFSEDLALAEDNFRRHCETPDFPYDQIVRYRHKNGSTVWVRCRGLIVRDAQGLPHRMLGVHQNVTEHKKHQLQLQNERERFELAAVGASVGIWEWLDVNGSEEYWSSKFYELLGYQDQEINASIENFRALLHPDDQARTFAAVQKHFDDNVPFDIEYRLKTKCGSYRWFRGSGIASRDAHGMPKRMVGSIQDVHDKKVYQEELEDTIAKLKQSNSDLERFAYVASHDLQEPVRVVASYAQLLERRYHDRLDDGARDFITFISDGCKRMQNLINDLLAFSRINMGEMEVESVDLNLVLDQVQRMLARQIDNSAAIVETPENLPSVQGCRVQLERLIQNLISNSLKYKREGVPPYVKVSVEKKKAHWHFSIEDNGIGIEEKFYDKIFVIFQRLHGVGQYSGTGVGLAVCKRIVDNHCGEIWLRSVPGSGSVFTFSLPR